MQKLLAFIGFLVLLVGLLPFLIGIPFLSFLEPIPIEGPAYHLIIIALGVLALYLGLKK